MTTNVQDMPEGLKCLRGFLEAKVPREEDELKNMLGEIVKALRTNEAIAVEELPKLDLQRQIPYLLLTYSSAERADALSLVAPNKPLEALEEWIINWHNQDPNDTLGGRLYQEMIDTSLRLGNFPAFYRLWENCKPNYVIDLLAAARYSDLYTFLYVLNTYLFSDHRGLIHGDLLDMVSAVNPHWEVPYFVHRFFAHDPEEYY